MCFIRQLNIDGPPVRPGLIQAARVRGVGAKGVFDHNDRRIGMLPTELFQLLRSAMEAWTKRRGQAGQYGG